MNDDRIDELLHEAARDYNEPGPVPRDEIWARIQHARAEQSRRPRKAGRSLNSLWVWPSLGVAAALLVSAGIVMGRHVERYAAAPAETASAAPSSSTPPLAADSTRSASSNLAYRLVLLQHLAGTEAMITAFQASAERGQTDTLITDWSRQLLGTTRLLAASPAADDPVMKRLLQDLDFVTTEIVQYSAHGVNDPDELRLIEQSIAERGVISKLRGTLPDRLAPAGT